MEELVYVSRSCIPSNTANSVNVVQQSSSFLSCFKNVRLIGLCDRENDDLLSYIKQRYQVRELPKLTLLKEKNSLIKKLFLFRVLPYIFRAKFLYTRIVNVAILRLILTRKVAVLECHGPFSNSQRMVLVGLLKYAKIYDRIRLVVISKRLRDIIENQLKTSVEILVEHDAVDIQNFQFEEKLLEPLQKLKVGYVGSFYKGRGIDIIFELAKRMPNVRFNLAGAPSDYLCALESNRHEELSNVLVEGYLSRDELFNFLEGCHVLLMPYQKEVSTHGNGMNSSEWMSPLKMFEYMAANRIILSSDLDVLREVLNESNSVLLPPNSADLWVKALQDIEHNFEGYVRRARKARNDVQHYTWDKRSLRISALITK